jgi:hypothetical protein
MLDPSFSGDGRAITAFDLGGRLNDAAVDMAIDSQGRIIVAGEVERAGGDIDFGVARYLPNG